MKQVSERAASLAQKITEYFTQTSCLKFCHLYRIDTVSILKARCDDVERMVGPAGGKACDR